MVTPRRAFRWSAAALLAALVVLCVSAAPASADPRSIFLDPLGITDSGNGEIRAYWDNGDEFGFERAGLQLFVKSPGTPRVYGTQGSAGFANVEGSTLDDPVNPGDPYVLTSKFTASVDPTALEVTQKISLIDGERYFDVQFQIRNPAGFAQSIVPKLFADLGPGEDTSGIGFDSSPLRGALSSDASNFAGLRSLSPATAVIQEGPLAAIQSKVQATDASGDLTSGIVSSPNHDTAAALQWGTFSAPIAIAPGATATFSARFRFAHLLRISPNEEIAVQGQNVETTATVTNFDSTPKVGANVRYKVDGANQRGSTPGGVTGSGGTTTVSYQGTNAGTDVVTIWDDRDGQTDLDPDEPRQTLFVRWQTPPQPPEPAGALAGALSAQDGLVTGASWLIQPPGQLDAGPADKVWNGGLAGFPTAGGSFAVMSSGDANAAGGSGGSTNRQGNSERGARDVSILRVDLNVPQGASCLAFDLKFFSDEGPGAQFNDAFLAQLDNSEWSVGTDAERTITAPSNFALDPQGKLLSVRSQGIAEMTHESAEGTGYSRATQLLLATTPITPGPHSVYFSIFDVGDDIVDSAAFIDALRTGTGTCSAGTRPPGSIDKPPDDNNPPPPPPPPPAGPLTLDKLPPAQLGRLTNAQPAKGSIRVRVPGSNRYVALEEAQQLPVGTLVNANRGTITLVSDGGPGKPPNKGDFGGGTFRIEQTSKNPLTTMSMVGGGLSGCKTLAPRGGARKPAQAAARRGRRLFSRATGRFRTRGRHSSATVRGTEWSMRDTCNGTLTVVQRGAVVVHDYRLRKNKTVKKGQRYFARALKKGKKRRRLG